MEISLRVIRGQLFGKVGMDVYLYPSTPNCMSIRMPTKILTTRKLITELKKNGVCAVGLHHPWVCASLLFRSYWSKSSCCRGSCC